VNSISNRCPADLLDAKLDACKFISLRSGKVPVGRFCEPEIFEMFQNNLIFMCEHYANSFPDADDGRTIAQYVADGDAHTYVSDMFAKLAELDSSAIAKKLEWLQDEWWEHEGQDELNIRWAWHYLKQYTDTVKQQMGKG